MVFGLVLFLHENHNLLVLIKIDSMSSGLQIRMRNYKLSFYFSTKIHVVGTKKNHLNEPQHICLN